MLWRFAKLYMRDWGVGEVRNRRAPLAVAVVGSSASSGALVEAYKYLESNAQVGVVITVLSTPGPVVPSNLCICDRVPSVCSWRQRRARSRLTYLITFSGA